MAQSDGKNKLSRFLIKDPKHETSFAFKLNPQKYKMTFPQRVSALKTLDRIVVEDFNGDIPTLSISGHTGFKHGIGEAQIRALRALLELYSDGTTNYGKSPKGYLELYNFTDEDYYYVTLDQEGYTISRDVENPLIFNYDLNFLIVGRIGKDIIDSDAFISSKEISTSDSNVGIGDAGTSSIGDNEVETSTTNKKTSNKGVTDPDKTGRPTKPTTVSPLIGTGYHVISGQGYGDGQLLQTQKSGSSRLSQIIGVD